MEQAKSLYTCILTHKTTSNMCTFIFPLHISHTTQYNTPIQRLSVLSVAHTPNTSQHWRAWIDRERKPASGSEHVLGKPFKHPLECYNIVQTTCTPDHSHLAVTLHCVVALPVVLQLDAWALYWNSHRSRDWFIYYCTFKNSKFSVKKRNY